MICTNEEENIIYCFFFSINNGNGAGGNISHSNKHNDDSKSETRFWNRRLRTFCAEIFFITFYFLCPFFYLVKSFNLYQISHVFFGKCQLPISEKANYSFHNYSSGLRETKRKIIIIGRFCWVISGIIIKTNEWEDNFKNLRLHVKRVLIN